MGRQNADAVLLRLDSHLALAIIAARGCESFTTGIGSCIRNGRHLVSLTGTADEACAPCVAYASTGAQVDRSEDR